MLISKYNRQKLCRHCLFKELQRRLYSLRMKPSNDGFVSFLFKKAIIFLCELLEKVHLMKTCQTCLIAQSILTDVLRMCFGQLLNGFLNHFQTTIFSHTLCREICVSSSAYTYTQYVKEISLWGVNSISQTEA